MTVAEARARLAKVEAMKGDDEGAHGEEDDFREAVLRAISQGEAEDPREMARIALETNEIDFARWCA